MGWKGALWLSLSSFVMNFIFTIEAVQYRSFFMAFLALWFFNLGTVLYLAYRLPKLGEGLTDADKKRRVEAYDERRFLITLFAFSILFSVLILSAFSGPRLSIAFLLVLVSIALLTVVISYHTHRAL